MNTEEGRTVVKSTQRILRIGKIKKDEIIKRKLKMWEEGRV